MAPQKMEVKMMGNDVEKKGSGQAWLMAILATVAAIVVCAGKYKLSPAMTTLLPALGVDKVAGGWLMSICSVMGIILAIPAGAIMTKTGPKKLGLVSLGFGLLGNLIGSLSGTYYLLLFSRLIEGISMGLIGVVVPTIIAAWFPVEKRGLPMSIFSLWIGLGFMFILNISPTFLVPYGWKGLWWFSTVLFAVMTVLWALFLKMPESATPANASAKPKAKFSEGMASPTMWILALVMLFFTVCYGTIQTYEPAYLQEGLGASKAAASQITSWLGFGNIIGAIVIGIILNKVKDRAMVIMITFIVGIFFINRAFAFPMSMAVAYFLAAGIILQFLPASIFAVAPETATNPAAVPIVMGMVAIGQNIGAFFGPPYIGAAIQSGGYGAVAMPFTVVAVVGAILAIVFWFMMKAKRNV